MKNLPYIIMIFLFSTVQVFASDKQDMLQFKAYLNEIKSVAIDFTQKDSAGNNADGKLLINKPHKFRCNYYPPFPLVVIGNKSFVSLYDYDMQHVSRIKTSENIFNFLLEERQDFDKNFNIKSIIDEKGFFIITIEHRSSERSSEITFDKSTKQIRMLKIFEDNNIITIAFHHITRVHKFDDDLFKLKNPDIFGPPARLDKATIEKKYIVSGK